MRKVVPGVELGRDLSVGAEEPVIDHPHDLPGERRRLAILDDEDAEEPAFDLLARAHVGMEPERARVPDHELVDEALAEPYRRLRDPGHSIHAVRNADAVPVDRSRLRKAIREADAERVADTHPQRGARHLSVVGPHVERASIHERKPSRRGDDVELAQLACQRARRRGLTGFLATAWATPSSPDDKRDQRDP